MTPKVSVIIPVYNTAPYLRRCLDSVRGQTLRDIEILCVNDASTDGGLDILKEYALNDSRIRIFDNAVNLGETNSRNLALISAKGEFVAFVDSDDSFEHNFLETLYSEAAATGADMVKGMMLEIAPEGAREESDMNDLIMKDGTRCFLYEFPTAIYKNKFIKQNGITFPGGLVLGGDLVFLARALLKANMVVCSDKTHYVYYRRPDSADTVVLDDDKIISLLRAAQLIIHEINNAEKSSLKDEEYDFIFHHRFLHILNNVSKTGTKRSKQLCAEAMVKLYDQCQRREILDVNLQNYYEVIVECLRLGDIAGLTRVFILNNNLDKLYVVSTLSRLRKNILKSRK